MADAGVITNTCLIVGPGGDIVGRYDKTHLYRGVSQEHLAFRPGRDLPVVDTPFGRVGVMICYDLRFPEVCRALAHQGAQVIFVPANFPKPRSLSCKRDGNHMEGERVKVSGSGGPPLAPARGIFLLP